MASAATCQTAQTLVFTYGTLKQNFPNHHIISAAAVLVSSSATTALPYPLLIGPYAIPYLINLPGYGHRVSGELYAVSNATSLSDLDNFEGLHNGHYERLPVKVVYDNGGDSIEKEVMAYFAHRRFAEHMWRRCGPEKAISEYKVEDAEKYVWVEQRPRDEVFFEVLGKFVGLMDGEDSLVLRAWRSTVRWKKSISVGRGVGGLGGCRWSWWLSSDAACGAGCVYRQ